MDKISYLLILSEAILLVALGFLLDKAMFPKEIVLIPLVLTLICFMVLHSCKLDSQTTEKVTK